MVRCVAVYLRCTRLERYYRGFKEQRTAPRIDGRIAQRNEGLVPKSELKWTSTATKECLKERKTAWSREGRTAWRSAGLHEGPNRRDRLVTTRNSSRIPPQPRMPKGAKDCLSSSKVLFKTSITMAMVETNTDRSRDCRKDRRPAWGCKLRTGQRKEGRRAA